MMKLTQAKLLPALFTALAGFVLLPYATSSAEGLAVAGRMTDDAYFYSVIARNYVDLGFLTLDGTMPTNGVQPLWMLLLISLLSLFPSIDEVLLVSRISWVIYLISTWMILRFIVRPESRSSCLLAISIGLGILLNPRFLKLVVNGQEVPLALAILAAGLFAFDSYANLDAENQRARRLGAFGLGILTGLTFLVRTDLFLLTPVVLIYLYIAGLYDRRLVAIHIVGSALIVCPYLAYNHVVFGAMVPISGRLKAYYSTVTNPGFAAYLSSGEWRGILTAILSPLPAISRLPDFLQTGVGYGIVVSGFTGLWRNRYRLSHGVLIIAITLFLHVCFMQFVYRVIPPYSAYYFAPLVILSYVGLGLLLAKFPRASVAAPILAGLVFLSLQMKTLDHTDRWAARLALALDISRTTHPDARIGAFWPGLFAQFSNRSVIPLDGIAGSPEYFENVIKSGTELDYLLRDGHGYLAIQLPVSLAQHMDSATSPASWGELGQTRLRELKDVDIRVLARRPFGVGDESWYFLELTRRSGGGAL